MGAGIAKNETVAAKRRIDLIVVADGGLSYAPRGTNFTSLGIVFVKGSTSPDYIAAAGTMTNNRRPLTAADDTVEAVDTGTNETLTLTAHVFETGDGPVRFTTTGTLPAPLATGTDYWIIKFDANKISVATSLANAYAGTKVNLTDAGTGTHTLDVTASTQRGLDGRFTYEFTQAETNTDASELTVIVEGSGYALASNGGGYATAQMIGSFTGFEATAENSRTYGDLMRIIARTLAARFSKTGNDYVYRDLANSKDSHSGTVTTTGRTAATIIDPT